MHASYVDQIAAPGRICSGFAISMSVWTMGEDETVCAGAELAA
jgi:hypothetical protein